MSSIFSRGLSTLSVATPVCRTGLRNMTRNMSSSNAEVLSKIEGNLCTATLNRPKAMNALNKSMSIELLEVYKEMERSDKVKVIALEGAGPKAFCAGGDVVAIAKAGMNGDLEPAKGFFTNEYILDNYIGNLKTPHVAILDGITMGGGVGLSVHGKYRVATEKTMFAMPETAIGLIPDVGGSYFLPKLQGELGMYLALTGDRLKGEDVFHSGIATHFVPSNSVPGLLLKLNEAETDEDVKLILDSFHAIVNETFSLEDKMPLINKCFAGDKMETMLESLKVENEWAQKQASRIETMSPTSCKLTVKQLREGAKKTSLSECLKMELGVVINCMKNKDFYEGIRALLIEKDNNPKWQPDSLDKIDDATIDAYFAPDNEVTDTLKF